VAQRSDEAGYDFGSVNFFVSEINLSQNYERILMKFCGAAEHGSIVKFWRRSRFFHGLWITFPDSLLPGDSNCMKFFLFAR